MLQLRPQADNPCCGGAPEEKTEEDCPTEELYAIGSTKTNDGLDSFTLTADFPVEVLSSDGSKVTFKVCNKLGNGLVFTAFMEDGGYECCELDETQEDCAMYTADCFVDDPIAVVDIHLTDPGTGDALDIEVPRCCHDSEESRMSAVFVFVLRCDCPAGAMA